MKKIIIYFLVFLLIFFILPAILTKKNVEAKVIEDSKENNTNIKSEKKYNYKKYG